MTLLVTVVTFFFGKKFQTHLAQVFFDSCCNVLPPLWYEPEQILQLLEPEFQRFGLPRLEGPPGPLHSHLSPRHLQWKLNKHFENQFWESSFRLKSPLYLHSPLVSASFSQFDTLCKNLLNFHQHAVNQQLYSTCLDIKTLTLHGGGFPLTNTNTTHFLCVVSTSC